MSEWTSGKFDVTFGALADVWKFDHDKDKRVPTEAEIAARLPLIDYRAVVVDETRRHGFHHAAGERIHLGGIGKGYAVDRAAAILRRHGFQRLHGAVGGDLYVAGQPGDESVAAGHQRSARRARRQLRDPRASRRDVQHVGRLRALLHRRTACATTTSSILTSASRRAAAAA